MFNNKTTSRASRTGTTTIIPVGAMPRTKAGFFGGEGLGPPGVLFCVLFCAASSAIMDFGVVPPPYVVNARSPIDFSARASYNYKDSDELDRRREESANRAPRVYVEEEEWEEKILGDLEKLTAIVDKASSENDAREKVAAEHFSQNYASLAGEMFKRRGPALTRLNGLIRDEMRKQFNEAAILSEEDYKREANKREPRTIVRTGKRGAEHAVASVSAKDYKKLSVALEDIQNASRRDIDNASLNLQWQMSAYLESKIRPGLIYDEARTEAKQREELAKVGGGEVRVEKGDTILKRTQIVRPATLEKLRQEYRAVKAGASLADRLKRRAGLATLAAGVLMVFFIVAGRVDPEIWERRRALVMLGLFSLGALAFCRALTIAGLSLAYAPFVFVGMAASLAFGQSVAMLTLTGLSLLAACATVSWEAVPIDGGMPFLSVALLAGGIAAALPAKKLRDRWDLLKYGVLGGLLQGSVVAGLYLLNAESAAPGVDSELIAAPWPRSGTPFLADALIAYCNGPVCGLLVLGSLPLIESLFGILTNIRLFELADMNQPALQLIQLEAPGTFAHTLQVRFLAEPASDAIGAHTRLVSAGVLYHDLGKTRKPEYFVENTPDAEIRHARLKPSVSALLIISHVKDGIDLAHEYKLPQQIVDFIPQHHGTTLVSYFYHSAVRDAEKDAQAEGGGTPGAEVEEAFFRYPGPKPRTRETGIVMLADTIEAASRTLQNPSATRLRQFVHDLIMDKMLDNQLDECDLTFADLALIEDAFLRVLATRFHSRIRYPGQDDEDAPENGREKESEIEEK